MTNVREPTETERFLEARCWQKLTDKEKECIAFLQSLGHRVILKNKIELRAAHRINIQSIKQYMALKRLRFIKKYPHYKLRSRRGDY